MRYVRIEGVVAYVELTRGLETIIDVADVPLVKNYLWHTQTNWTSGFYARTGRGLLMHRLITGCPKGKEVDHINHDTLDNRRSNLRIVTHKQNQQNGKWALKTHCPKGHPYDVE